MNDTKANVRLLEEQQRLFLSVTERLSHLFVQIARLSEQISSENPKDAAARLAVLRDVSQSAAVLTEAYSMDGKIRGRLLMPEQEVVTVSSLLHEISRTLQPYACRYGVTVSIEDAYNLSPVIGDPVILGAAFASLGQVFVQAIAECDEKETLHLAAYRSRYGIVAGVYTSSTDITTDAFRRARKMYGRVSEPFSTLVSGPATGVFVADSLLQLAATKLHVAHYHHRSGLAATLPICSQLQLV